jgi:hypothetical protein
MTFKTFKVQMLAFCEAKDEVVRLVELPAWAPVTLDVIFCYGQNDFQPRSCPSLSSGDVIELGNEFHLILSVGFMKISPEQLDKWKQLERRDRSLGAFSEEHFLEAINE